MSVTFVTAFLKLSDRNPDEYVSQFKRLANTGIDILLFLDEAFQSIGNDICAAYPNVRVAEYLSLDPIPDNVILPESRNVQKDSPEYLIVQLSKLKCMAKALQYTTRPYIAWIDFRIFHIFHDRDRASRTLRSIEQNPPKSTRILAPGCWDKRSRPIWNSILWRFCGGFLLGHRDLIQAAYDTQTTLVTEGLPRLTWEVNYWTLMEDMFEWYPGDHNETILPRVQENGHIDACEISTQ